MGHAEHEPLREAGAAADGRDPEASTESLRLELDRLRVLASKDRGLLDAVLAHSPHGVIVCDLSGKLVLHNAAAERIWAGGRTGADIEGWGAYRAFHDDGRPYEGSDWPMARCLREQTEIGATEFRIQRFDDSFGWLIGSCAPLYGEGGRLDGALSIFVDVTRLKETERAHEEAAERLRFLGEMTALLSASLDYTSNLERLAFACVPVLADWCAIDILDEDGVIRRLAVAHPDQDKVALVKALQERYPSNPNAATGVPNVLRTGRMEWMREVPAFVLEAAAQDEEHLRLIQSLSLRSYACLPLEARGRIFGALTLVLAESERLFDEDDVSFAGEVARRAAIHVDNARLYKEAQAALAAADRERRQKDRVIEALARSNAELDQFAYVASHDLKAPLRGISNLSTWIEEDLGDRMTPDTRKQMELLRGRVHRMESLIDGILSYSRAGRSKEDVRDVDVKRLLDGILDLLPTERARVDVAEGMPVLKGDRAMLGQVFLNLIGNALKHSDKESPEVSVTAADEGAAWRFSVADNGPGVAPEFHGRIFELFQTLSRRDDMEGAGIGLSVVRKIVERQGGTVAVASAPGEGATFSFTWPKAPHHSP